MFSEISNSKEVPILFFISTILIPKYNPHTKSSHRRCSAKKGVLRNFAKFTGKHLCQRLFFKKHCTKSFLLRISWFFVQRKACYFIKKETLAQAFSCELCEISKNLFFYRHFRATTSYIPEFQNDVLIYHVLINIIFF